MPSCGATTSTRTHQRNHQCTNDQAATRLEKKTRNGVAIITVGSPRMFMRHFVRMYSRSRHTLGAREFLIASALHREPTKSAIIASGALSAELQEAVLAEIIHWQSIERTLAPSL